MSIFKTWMALSPQKQLASVLSVLATLGAFWLLLSTTLKPKTDLLYSGLDPAAAGEVVAKLEAMDIIYEVRGDAIYADRSRRDSLRLELARDGLPRQTNMGYELFDDLNSFAMTSDMFDTSYWRAKEGELARTLLSMDTVRSARVHLGTQKTRGFSSDAGIKTASVTITAAGRLTPSQAKAIQYMTALAVSGLAPTDVAVIDTIEGVIAGPGIDETAVQGGTADLERAAAIKSNLMSLLEARVGLGNARVSVSLDFKRDHITTTERRFDPDGRVLKSQVSSETTDVSQGTNNAVTVASNLPEGEAGENRNSANRAITNETVNYEVSETLRNSETLPGGVRRMTVAVLLNDIVNRSLDGTVERSPRSEAELTALADLITAAAGLEDARGDVLSLKSLAFDAPTIADALPKPSLLSKFLEQYLWSIIQALILGVVVLMLGLFVVRPLFKPMQTQGYIEGDLVPMSLGGPIAQELVNDAATAGNRQSLSQAQSPVLLGEPNAAPEALVSADPITALLSAVEDQPDDAADLLAQWLEQDTKAQA